MCTRFLSALRRARQMPVWRGGAAAAPVARTTAGRIIYNYKSYYRPLDTALRPTQQTRSQASPHTPRLRDPKSAPPSTTTTIPCILIYIHDVLPEPQGEYVYPFGAQITATLTHPHTEEYTESPEKKDTAWPPHSVPRSRGGKPKHSDYHANVGEAVELLKAELPQFFHQRGLATTHIYDEHIMLCDPHITRFALKGRVKYQRLAHTAAVGLQVCWRDVKLRVLSMQRVQTDDTDALKMQWRVTGSPKLAVYGSGERESYLEGVSWYYFNDKGRIDRHELTITHPRPPEVFVRDHGYFPWFLGWCGRAPCPCPN